jgi:hypothetical protein
MIGQEHMSRENRIKYPNQPRQFVLAIIAAVLSLTLAVMPSNAKDSHSTQVQTANNVDGSAFKLITKASKQAGLQVTEVKYRRSEGAPMKTIGEIFQPVGENIKSMVFVIDWDKDGVHEIETVDECDAGPNCTGMIYRIDPRKEKVVEFFKTSGADVSLINGYLIEKGRDSCCAWGALAFKLNSGRTEVASSPTFSVLVEYDDDKNRSRPVTCTFYQDKPGSRLVIKPPAKAFLKICRHYGAPYKLIINGKIK